MTNTRLLHLFLALTMPVLSLAQCSGLKAKICKQTAECLWSGGDCILADGGGGGGPSPPPSPAWDGICTCGECDFGVNQGQGCLADASCGGTCSENSSSGQVECTNDNMCLPNNGKPSSRGYCVTTPGICQQAAACPQWLDTPGNPATYKPGFVGPVVYEYVRCLFVG